MLPVSDVKGRLMRCYQDYKTMYFLHKKTEAS